MKHAFHGQCSKKHTVTKLHWLYLIFAIYLRNSIFFYTTSFALLLTGCVCVWTIFIFNRPHSTVPLPPPLKCRAWKLLNVNELETRKSTNWLIELEWLGDVFFRSLSLFHAVVSLRFPLFFSFEISIFFLF